jgi:hypothetical protein
MEPGLKGSEAIQNVASTPVRSKVSHLLPLHVTIVRVDIVMYCLALLSLFCCVYAQESYVHTNGGSRPSKCSASATAYTAPIYSISSFAFTQNETVRTATSVPAPTSTTTYAPPHASLKPLMSRLSTTTWGSWNPNATVTPTDTNDPYGNAAWTALWKRANPPNFTESAIYSTTVSPAPVPTSELVLPPADYFGPTDCYYFPEDFVFGMAGSAAQIEGAVAEEGRTPTLLELLISDSRPKDYVTNENYYLYKQDIERLAAQGVEYYSFSIAWTRILPFALPGTPVNKQGIDHYDDLINFVLEKGMKPAVTLFHFDTPLQFFGNRSTIADKASSPRVESVATSDYFLYLFSSLEAIILCSLSVVSSRFNISRLLTG